MEDANAEATGNARYQSDLAAAYLARAKAVDRPDDLPKALAAADRAIAADDMLEARFNRALALQALYLEDQARQAWDEYLKRDASSDWAEDARRHLAALQESAKSRGANAVVDIVSFYKQNEFKSATNYECYAGTILAGVALKGTYAKLK